MANRKRKTVWEDEVVNNTTLAATSILDTVILPEARIETLGDITVTRIIGELTMSFTVGNVNTVKAAIWIAAAYGGATTPADWNADAFQRSRVMWTMHRQMRLTDDTLFVPIDIRTKRKMSSGTELLLSIENTSGNLLSMAFHIRTLMALS